jgi:hypothetical protein
MLILFGGFAMKKIMMNKYGFVRWPEEDFSDDGNRFYCYKVGSRVRVSKLVSDGVAYISARIDHGTLPYAVYSKLPHYSKLDDLNGVSVISLDDNDLFDLCEACLMYDKEYSEAEAAIVYPTEDEIRSQCIKIKAKRMAELAEVEAKLASNVIRLAMTIPEWQWKTLREYLISLKQSAEFDVDEKARNMYKSSYSFNFVKENYHDLDDSYYYKWIIDLFKK